MRRLLFLLLTLAFLLALAGTASAQTTVFNPKVVQFTASSSHTAQLADGTNLLTGYRLKHFLVGGTSPIMTVDLCKPIPDTAGNIIVTTTSLPCPTGGPLFASPLAINTSYVARVTAYGPGGESAVSLPSNPFVLSGGPSPIAAAPIIRQD